MSIDEHPAPAQPAPQEGEPVVARGSEWWRLALVVAGVVLLGLLTNVSVVAIVVAIVVMIFLHELGHYVTAKAAGMKVTEFFIGFGPRLWSFRRGETEYGLKAIPAGAYVKVIGMSNLEEIDPADEHRTYRQKPYWRRLSVAVAGSAMHFFLAVVLFYGFLVGSGMAREDLWTVRAVSADAPAAEAGLRPDDRIVEIDGRELDTFEEVSEYIAERPGEDVDLVVERGGERVGLEATLADENPDGERVGFLGIRPEVPVVKEGLVSGIPEAFSMTGETMRASVQGLVSFFSPSGISGYADTLADSTQSEPSGSGGGGQVEADPRDQERVISILGAVQIASGLGFGDVVGFLAAINVFIGIFNLVPLLPLDGGHVAIATYERIRSRKGRPYHADVGKLMPLTYAVLLVLLVVGVTSVYLDISDPVTLN